MGLIATQGVQRPPTPEGVYMARCYAVYDLGTQVVKFNDAEKESHKVLIMWEIPSERIDLERDGKILSLPRAINQRYTLSLDRRATLRKHLDAWRGKGFTADELNGFDLATIVGACCQIQVIHQASQDGSKTYANIGAIMAMPKGAEAPEAENPQVFYSMGDDGLEPPKGTPEWIVETVHKSLEWIASAAAGNEGSQDANDDLSYGGHDEPDPAFEDGSDAPF